MNDKVTLQAVSDIFSRQYGISKKTTDAFGKSFFDTIVDGLNADGQVKIKGLGTFKIVEVGSRESVNVTNGERIVIDGYRKVAFVPDELAEMKQQEQNVQLEQAVSLAGEQAVSLADAQMASLAGEQTSSLAGAQPVSKDNNSEIILVEPPVIDVEKEASQEVTSIVFDENAVPENVEVPSDEFSGIDMLISTPESIEEVQKDLKMAQIRAEQTLEEAKQANIEYRRLEVLLERLMANSVPEVLEKAAVAASVAPAVQAFSQPLPEPVDEAPVEALSEVPTDNPTVDSPIITENEAASAVSEVAETVAEVSEPEAAETPTEKPLEPKPTSKKTVQQNPSHEEALKRYLSDDSGDDDDDDDDDSGSNRKLWIIIPLVGILLAAIAIFAYRYIKYNSPFETDDVIEDVVVPEDTTATEVVDTATAVISNITEPTQEMKEAEAKAAAEKKAAEEKAAEEKKAAEKAAAEKAAAEKKAAEEKAAAEKAAKAKKPKTYTIQKGESLTRISQRFYNTKDSVNAIIRLNNFPDPNNVPIGSVIKLP